MINKTSNNSLLDFKGQSVITPWDRLKKYIFKSYPVVHVDKKITDTEELTKLAAEHVGKSDMVWVVLNTATINPLFPWHYRPTDMGHNVIHKFPKVIKRTGRPVNWGEIQFSTKYAIWFPMPK